MHSTFNSLLGHTSYFVKFEKLPLGPIKQHYTITGRQHTLWSTYVVLFLNIATILQQKANYISMAFLCCSQKWSVAPLYMK